MEKYDKLSKVEREDKPLDNQGFIYDLRRDKLVSENPLEKSRTLTGDVQAEGQTPYDVDAIGLAGLSVFRLPKLKGLSGQVEDVQVLKVKGRLEQWRQYDTGRRCIKPSEPRTVAEQVADELYKSRTQTPSIFDKDESSVSYSDSQIRARLRLSAAERRKSEEGKFFETTPGEDDTFSLSGYLDRKEARMIDKFRFPKITLKEQPRKEIMSFIKPLRMKESDSDIFADIERARQKKEAEVRGWARELQADIDRREAERQRWARELQADIDRSEKSLEPDTKIKINPYILRNDLLIREKRRSWDEF